MTSPTRTGGLTEIGELLGVTRQRAFTLAKRADFPEPVAISRAGRVWDLDQVEEWGKTWDRHNKGGRPRRSGRGPKEINS
ncbi:helix-turn-helix transcriptional regulator [Streptomyces asiaticus]